MLLSDHPLVMAEKGFPAVERAIRVMDKQKVEIERLREGFIQVIDFLLGETKRFRGELDQMDDSLKLLKQQFIDEHKE